MLSSKSIGAIERHLLMADLSEFGHRFGIHYEFPQMITLPDKTPILYGHVQEFRLASGLNFTYSSLDVLRSYATSSIKKTKLFILIVLEGVVQLCVDGHEYVVKPGMAFTTSLSDSGYLQSVHSSNQHLNTITLAIDEEIKSIPQPFSTLLDRCFKQTALLSSRLWYLPTHLYMSLRQLDKLQLSSAQQHQLVIEGFALQLMAYGLEPSFDLSGERITPEQRRRLNWVRYQIDRDPTQDYLTKDLAKQAAMSESSFRNKFQSLFGVSVVEYIRSSRLNLARDYLLKGCTVEQAAHFSGYRHATNFTTAFRRHFGVTPSQSV